MDAKLYPLLFEPVYKDYVWGGRRIPELFDRLPQQGVCAESWEISDRPEGMSRVCNGPLEGRSLHELVRGMGSALSGTSSADSRFPLLIKIIDAKRDLSVQVHPSDASAAEHGGEPKTEAWYVLDADPETRIVSGLLEGTDREAVAAAIERGELEAALRLQDIREGQVLFVPGGTVHALGAGAMVLEVQQNSNTTYRLYDWHRPGTDGKPRELHVDAALEVTDWPSAVIASAPRNTPGPGVNAWWELLRCPYFRLRRVDLREAQPMANDGRSFHALFTVRGRHTVSTSDTTLDLGPGASCLLPAGISEYRIAPLGTGAEIILISLV